MCVHALFIKIVRVFTICGGDVAPFISIISAKEFARVEAVAPLLICQLNVTENTRGGGGSVDLAQVFFFSSAECFHPPHHHPLPYRITERKYCFNNIQSVRAKIPTIVPVVLYIGSSASHVFCIYMPFFSDTAIDTYPLQISKSNMIKYLF